VEAIAPLSTRYSLASGQEQFEPELKALAETFAQRGENIYKARNEIKRMDWDGVPVIVKSFKVPDPLRGLIYGQLRKSKARRSFENALELQRRGISTPAPIGFIEQRATGALKQSFYVCQEWANAFLFREPLFKPALAHRTEILQAFGRFTWALHRKQIHHRDFSPGNILIKEKPADAGASSERYAFCLVDINRMRFESLSLEQRMNNFAMLWASDEDLKTIVTGYTLASGDPLPEALALALNGSQAHKRKANRKEQLKSLLGLH
jgi:tRNA A-37 threonylcarbamoyl transferase component Bud32